MLTRSFRQHITFELYLNDPQMRSVDETVISGPRWLVSDLLSMLIIVGCRWWLQSNR